MCCCFMLRLMNPFYSRTCRCWIVSSVWFNTAGVVGRISSLVGCFTIITVLNSNRVSVSEGKRGSDPQRRVGCKHETRWSVIKSCVSAERTLNLSDCQQFIRVWQLRLWWWMRRPVSERLVLLQGQTLHRRVSVFPDFFSSWCKLNVEAAGNSLNVQNVNGLWLFVPRTWSGSKLCTKPSQKAERRRPMFPGTRTAERPACSPQAPPTWVCVSVCVKSSRNWSTPRSPTSR